MLFAHDTEVALTAAAALVNSDDRDGERLPDVAALAEFFSAYGWTGRRDGTVEELQADEDEAVEIVNALLAENNALPQLVRHDNWPYHVHAVPADAPLASRMAVEAAMAFVDVIREGELGRLRICEYHDCESVVVDLSKNRSKRFCDLGCGNRAAVNAYRARKAAARRE
jgi:predicted RNA-binding Zn ribbon-like protein